MKVAYVAQINNVPFPFGMQEAAEAVHDAERLAIVEKELEELRQSVEDQERRTKAGSLDISCASGSYSYYTCVDFSPLLVLYFVVCSYCTSICARLHRQINARNRQRTLASAEDALRRDWEEQQKRGGTAAADPFTRRQLRPTMITSIKDAEQMKKLHAQLDQQYNVVNYLEAERNKPRASIKLFWLLCWL